MKQFFVILNFFLIFFCAKSQDSTFFSKETEFINHLINKKKFDDALFLLQKFDYPTIPTFWKDSLYFLTAKLFDYQDISDSAIVYFNKISPSSKNFLTAKYFSSYHHLVLQNDSAATEILTQLPDSNEVKQIHLAGISLLNKNIQQFQTHSQYFSKKNFQLQAAEENLEIICNEMNNFKSKSPFLAGFLSTICPGAGKFYIGKIGEGVAALLSVGILGAITTENYLKQGFSAKTIFFSGMFGIFYLGNIYGSFYGAKRYENEFFYQQKTKILISVKIPLKN